MKETFTFDLPEPPKYVCPTHGVVEGYGTIAVNRVGRDPTHHCMLCCVEWIEKNLPEVTMIEESNARESPSTNQIIR